MQQLNSDPNAKITVWTDSVHRLAVDAYIQAHPDKAGLIEIACVNRGQFPDKVLEFNRAFEETLTSHGLRITGRSADGKFVEICELPKHPWFLGCQFHPEFKSKPMEPHPLFVSFIGASYQHRLKRLANEVSPLFAGETQE